MKPMLIPLLALGLMSGASAQVSLTTFGTPYTQDFDTLPASGSATWTNNSSIPGWFHARTGTGTTIVANNGGSNAGNLYSYGTGTATERALGSVGSGGAGAGNFFWGVRLQNNTGGTITSLQVNYTGEQWRNGGNTTPNVVAFSYLVGAPTVTGSLAEFQLAGTAVAALNFTSPINTATAAALDGNAAANRVAISHTITGLSIPNGTEVMLRWSDPDHAGADHGMSIDDLSVTANGVFPFAGGGLTIPSVGAANPYPSTINVAGLTGSVVDLTVRINGYSHTFPRDVDVLLVAPNGQRSIVFSDVGGPNPGVSNIDLAFNDSAATTVDPNVAPVSGTTYRPTDNDAMDNFPAPAPAAPHPTGFAAFFGPAAAQNGAWQLFVVDDIDGDAGSIASWALEFTLAPLAEADLVVTLADAPDPVLAGNTLTYTATGTNDGPAAADDVSLSLPLPATTTFVSVTPSMGGLCTNPAVGANGTVACSWAGATADGASRSMTVVVNVPAATANGSVLSATLTGASATTDPNTMNNTAAVATGVNTAADIAAALTGSPDPVNAGGQLTYVATATNGGPSDAQGVSLTLPLPAGTSFVSATPSAGGACNAASPVVCSWAGASVPTTVRTATVVALVAPDVANGTVLNAEATAAATTSDPVPGNDVAAASTSVAVAADLSMALTVAPDPVTAGTNLSYLATLTNGGPSSAQDVSISLPLPGGTSFVSATPSAGGSCNAASPVVCSWAGTTAPAASRSVTVVAAVPASVLAGTVLSATATAGALSNDPNGANDSASASTTVAASADLVLAFTASPTSVAPGLPITFTGTATNNGPSDAQDVQIAIALGQGVLFSSSSASAGGTCTGPAAGSTGPVTCTWSGASAPGSVRSVAVTAYSYNRGTAGANASATSATSDPTPANNAASGSVVVGTGGVQDPPVFIPTADRTVLALLALLLGLVGFVAVRRNV